MHRYSVEFYVKVVHVPVTADDMGLGKTLTMIALVLKAKEEIENEGMSEEDADEENESSWYSGKQTCKYYYTFPRHFHFLQFYHLCNSQSISILPELTSFFPLLLLPFMQHLLDLHLHI
jgi:type VI protein secretion system component VasA